MPLQEEQVRGDPANQGQGREDRAWGEPEQVRGDRALSTQDGVRGDPTGQRTEHGED